MRGAVALLALIAAPLAAHATTVHGVIAEQGTGAPLAGVTIVVSGPSSQTTITEDDGHYAVDLPPGTYLFAVFFGELTVEHADFVVPDAASATVSTIALDTTAAAGDEDDYYWNDPWFPAAYSGAPPTSSTVRRSGEALLGRRDHRGLVELDARWPTDRATTVVDTGLRLPGAPAIAIELLDQLDAYADHAPIELAGATGGTDAVALVHGTNGVTGDARLALGRTGRLGAVAGGPLVTDHWWLSNGVVLDQTAAGLGVQALGAMDVIADPEQQLAASVLVTRAPGGGRDDWAEAHAILKGDDNKREIQVGLVGERLAPDPAGSERRTGGAASPRAVDRLGGSLAFRRRNKWHGYHTTIIGGELGGGHADGVVHTDVRGFASDSWQLRPTVQLDAGVRWDRRVVGGAAIELWSPRLSIAWDPTEEGHAMLFAAVERTGHLDERSLGAWRDGDTHGDSARAGYVRDWHHLQWTAAVRGTIAGLGLEGTARLSMPAKDLEGQVSVSTLARAATLTATWAPEPHHVRDLQLAAIARATPEAIGWGASAGYRHATFLPDGVHVTLGVEVFDLQDAARRAAHLVLTAAF